MRTYTVTVTVTLFSYVKQVIIGIWHLPLPEMKTRVPRAKPGAIGHQHFSFYFQFCAHFWKLQSWRSSPISSICHSISKMSVRLPVLCGQLPLKLDNQIGICYSLVMGFTWVKPKWEVSYLVIIMKLAIFLTLSVHAQES